MEPSLCQKGIPKVILWDFWWSAISGQPSFQRHIFLFIFNYFVGGLLIKLLANWFFPYFLICFNKSWILTKTTAPHNTPTQTTPCPWGTTFQCLNQVWSWSNFQDCFITINQDDLKSQRWLNRSNLWSGTLNVLQVLQIPFSKLNQINSQFLTKLVKSTKLIPPRSNLCAFDLEGQSGWSICGFGQSGSGH